MNTKTLSEQMRNGLVFLMLGQKHLSLETGVDSFLIDIIQKYSPEKVETPESYFSFFDTTAQSNKISAIAWINNRCDRLTAPDWLKTVAKYPWNGVYTTAIDTLWYRTFRNNWRTISPIYDKKYNPPDIRSRTKLHGTFLFGSIGGDTDSLPPFNKMEWRRKKLNSLAILGRFWETITPLGVLLVEGYSIFDDWLPFEEFIPVIDSLETGQVHFFSVTDRYFENLDFRMMVESKKIICHSESLASFLLMESEQGNIKLDEEPEDYGDHTLRLHDKTISIPADLWNQVARSAVVLEDRLLYDVTESADTRYANFLSFLQNSSNIPVWEGYQRGLAFQRNYESQLWNQVQYALDNVDKTNEPVILHGQSGTGKTVALGRLAVDVRRKLFHPVLFIERKSTKPSMSDLDEFCKWVEDNGANAILVIWDGMEEPDQYYKALRYLLGRGRKITIVGSCYRVLDSKKNFIEAPSDINDDERQRLAQFLKKIDPDINLDRRLQKRKSDSTFFVALYRLLPPTRGQLRQNLNIEVIQTEDIIFQRALENPPIPLTTLGFALYQAGFKPDNDNTFKGIVQRVDGEDINLIRKLVGLIMVPGRFGHKVPFELLLRALKSEWMEQLTDYLQQDIFRWEEDILGQVSIGPRHPLEAQLIVQYRFGSANAEISFVRDLLLELSDSENGDTAEIQFAVDLVRSLGPNGRDWDYFAPFALNLANTLRELREEIGVVNSRLLLQEATLIREFVIWNSRRNFELENSRELVDKAEAILQQALKRLEARNLRLRHVILVELGTLLATKTRLFLDQELSNTEIEKLFEQAKNNLSKSMTLDPEDYHPVDVLSWLSLKILKARILNDKNDYEVRADLLHTLFSIDGDGYDPEQYKMFLERRLEVADFIENKRLADNAFNALAAEGSKAGYYLRAMQFVGDQIMKNKYDLESLDYFQQAATYLEENRQNIKGDGRCLSLLLRTWWISKAKKPILSGERQTVPFKEEDWSYVLNLTSEILNTEDLYATPLIKYIQGIALFQLGSIENSIRAFRELEQESDLIQGRKRIVRSYIVSESDGKPKEYNGQVAWINDKGDRGQVFVEQLRSRILFIPSDFYSGKEFKKNDPLPTFHIAFNFIGPIADSKKNYLRK